jgi:hypothetical protein
MGNSDNLELGTWNATCDACGRKFKASRLRKRWDGFMVCEREWEPRHPQDFVRARPSPDPAPLPWTRTQPDPSFVLFCTPDGRTSVPDLAIPGCMLPGFIDPANTQGF